jgi:hypothetical protein
MDCADATAKSLASSTTVHRVDANNPFRVVVSARAASITSFYWAGAKKTRQVIALARLMGGWHLGRLLLRADVAQLVEQRFRKP